jgi:hypothetical protein
MLRLPYAGMLHEAVRHGFEFADRDDVACRSTTGRPFFVTMLAHP